MEAPVLDWDLDLSQFDGSQELKNILEIGDLDGLSQTMADVVSKPEPGDDSPCGSPLGTEPAAPAQSMANPNPASPPDALMDQEVSLDFNNHMDLMFFKEHLDSAINDGDLQTAENYDNTITVIPGDIDALECDSGWLKELARSAFDNDLGVDSREYNVKIEPVSINAVTSTSSAPDINDDELTTLSVKDLNRRLQCLPKDRVKYLKQRRRTLKNRGYAAHSRERRQKDRSELETENSFLIHALRTAKAEVAKLRKDCDVYKRECQRLKEQQVPSPLSTL